MKGLYVHKTHYCSNSAAEHNTQPKIMITSYSKQSVRQSQLHLLNIAPPCLAEWSLTINGSKTERTSISRHVDRIEEEWRMTSKLGSLLGAAEDVARRKQLANVAFRKLWTVWFRRTHIILQLRLRLYAWFVIPVLTYNMGTWGLTQAELVRIDTYHRLHLRQIIGVHRPNRISNVALYHRCQSRPISVCREMPPPKELSTTISPTQMQPRSEVDRGHPCPRLCARTCDALVAHYASLPTSKLSAHLAENNGDRWSGISLPETSFPIETHFKLFLYFVYIYF